jgi:chemotaxis protein histidine kinase CheA
MILRVIVGTAAVVLISAASGESRAADQDALLEQMTSFNKAAVTAYSEGDLDKAKAQLLKAVALAKKDSSLSTHPLMARTYVHLGVLYVDGMEDRKAGVSYFTKALKIRPDITVTEALATKTVKSAFEEAGGRAGGTSGEAVAHTEGARDESAKEEKQSRGAEKQPAKTTTAERKRAEADEDDSEESSEAQTRAEAKGKSTREKALAREKAEKEELLSEAKGMLKQTQREKQEIEKQAQKQKQELEKEKQEKQETEKRAQAEKSRLEKELAQVKDSEAKERAAKEKFQTELAEVKTALQQLQKDKADKEKQLADTGGREKKEREAKEKLEKEKQALAEIEKERKAREDAERAERERLAAGPDMPSNFSDPVYCAMPDEAKAGTDLFVHCVAKPNVKANVIAFYYRPSGGILYNAVTLEPAKKGWQATVIPAEKVTGKVMQYYTEARDSSGALVAATGKAASPNILPIKQSNGAGLTVNTTTRTSANAAAAAAQGRRLKLAR